MALIKCEKCGHEISDKAIKCPKCGYKVVHETMHNQRLKWLWIVLSVLLLVLLVVFCFHGYGDMKIENNGMEVVDSCAVDSIGVDSIGVEEAITDSVAVATVENVNEGICEEYERLLDENRASEGDCEYFLYDIDNDDMPELWMRVGSCEANYRLLVYTYKNGIKQLYEDGAGHSYFCMGTNYILQVWGHMGEASWSKLTYDGTKIVAKTIFEEDIRDSERDYKKPQEPEIDFNPSNDKQPIYDVFAVE